MFSSFSDDEQSTNNFSQPNQQHKPTLYMPLSYLSFFLFLLYSSSVRYMRAFSTFQNVVLYVRVMRPFSAGVSGLVLCLFWPLGCCCHIIKGNDIYVHIFSLSLSAPRIYYIYIYCIYIHTHLGIYNTLINICLCLCESACILYNRRQLLAYKSTHTHICVDVAVFVVVVMEGNWIVSRDPPFKMLRPTLNVGRFKQAHERKQERRRKRSSVCAALVFLLLFFVLRARARWFEVNGGTVPISFDTLRRSRNTGP